MNKTKQCKTQYEMNLMNPNKLKTLGQKTQDHDTTPRHLHIVVTRKGDATQW